MAQRSRDHLRVEFRDGERPTGTDFADLFDSFVNKTDDRIDVNENDNLDIPGGLNLKDAPAGVEGTLRFNSGQLQIFDGANWTNVGGGGAFTIVDDGPNAVFEGGNVGIGELSEALTHRLQVELGDNASPENRVKFGNAVISNGEGDFDDVAQFSYFDKSEGNNDFALRQGPDGRVFLNAPEGQSITIMHNGTDSRVVISGDGEVTIEGDLIVNGNASKTGGGEWDTLSDAQLKKGIKDFKDGLEKLMKVRPVRFKYNGKFNTDPEQEEVGVIGQEIREVFPYMTSSRKVSDSVSHGLDSEEVLMFNGHALTYVMVNAVQELAGKVDKLMSRLRKLEKQARDDK